MILKKKKLKMKLLKVSIAKMNLLIIYLIEDIGIINYMSQMIIMEYRYIFIKY